MKKILFIISLSLFIVTQFNAQTNTFPTSGNVGIGTTTPSSELEIKSSSNNNSELHINTAADNGISIIRFQDAGQNTWGFLSNYPNIGKFSLHNYQNNSYAYVIDQNGNVGIGTTVPDSKLTVKGHVNIGGDGNYRLKTRHIDGKHYSNSTTHDLHLNWNTGKHVLVGFGGQNSNMYVSGNLGIGTTAPDAKLAVKGNIHTNEVKVDLLGAVAPDYVFYKDYDLKTLNEVENYIAKEGHLPNIPSAKEMETNGLLLKEMNLKLLEKIEELILYTIQQEKEIKTSKNETTALKSEVENQKIINKSLEQRLQKIEALLNSIKQ